MCSGMAGIAGVRGSRWEVRPRSSAETRTRSFGSESLAVGARALPQAPCSQPRKFPMLTMLVGRGICIADQKKDY